MKKNYKLIPFNFKELSGSKLAVNILGEYAFLTDKSLRKLVGGTEKDSNILNKFSFSNKIQFKRVVDKYRKNKRYLNGGTSLFIFVLTKGCNLDCIYCQASRLKYPKNVKNMSLSIAKLAVDFVFKSPQRNITIEFQGGEPLINYKVLKYIVERTRKMEKETDKNITFNLVTNLTLLSGEILQFILKNDVSVCTSLDGPKNVHDSNRPYSKGSSYDEVIKKVKFIHGEAKIRKKRLSVNAIQTTTRKSLGYPKEIIDSYTSLGLHSIYLRPLNKFGFASKTFEKIGYSPEEFLSFYKKSLNYIIKLNTKGYNIIEGTAQVFLNKIFSYNTIRNMDVMSPCGAGIGQIAINFDGDIYTCDEGRMVADMGDNAFRLGSIKNMLFKDLHNNDVTKIMCVASCLEGATRCRQCPYLPYCGICPIVNYTEEGNLFKNNSRRCIINEGILDLLFKYIKKNDAKTIKLFKSWAQRV